MARRAALAASTLEVYVDTVHVHAAECAAAVGYDTHAAAKALAAGAHHRADKENVCPVTGAAAVPVPAPPGRPAAARGECTPVGKPAGGARGATTPASAGRTPLADITRQVVGEQPNTNVTPAASEGGAKGKGKKAKGGKAAKGFLAPAPLVVGGAGAAPLTSRPTPFGQMTSTLRSCR